MAFSILKDHAYCTVPEAARILALTERAVQIRIHNGELAAVRTANGYRIPRTALTGEVELAKRKQEYHSLQYSKRIEACRKAGPVTLQLERDETEYVYDLLDEVIARGIEPLTIDARSMQRRMRAAMER